MDFQINNIDSKLYPDSDNDSTATFLEASYAAHAYMLCRLMHQSLDSPPDKEIIENELDDILNIMSQINNQFRKKYEILD
tara:strand:+ start:116 stop:355 length:240 start_codon:yes stop_codon:yes gene_type:complete